MAQSGRAFGGSIPGNLVFSVWDRLEDNKFERFGGGAVDGKTQAHILTGSPA